MQYKNILFILLVSISCSSQGYSASYLFIGYKSQMPIYRCFEDNNLYSFNGNGFVVYKKELKNYKAVFVNENLEVYSSVSPSSKEVVIIKDGIKSSIMLSRKPERLVASSLGDTLFFTTGDEDIERLNVMVVKSRMVFKGVRLNYEEYWYVGGKILYAVSDKNHMRRLFIGDAVSQEKATSIVVPQNIEVSDLVSDDGRFLFAKAKVNNNGNDRKMLVISLFCGKMIEEILPYYGINPVFLHGKLYYYDERKNNIQRSSMNIEYLCH